MTGKPSLHSATSPHEVSTHREASTLSTEEVAALQVTPRRHYGRWALGALLLLLAALLIQAVVTNDNIDKAVIGEYLFSGEIVSGLKNTVLITLLAMVIALVLGTTVAAMRTSGNSLARWLAWAFAFFFRSTPVLVQLFFWFNLALIFPMLTLGIPGTDLQLAQWNTNTIMTPLVAAALGLGLSESAYYSVIVRGGLNSVDPGQREAAQAIGLSPFQTFRKIVLPQTIRIILPPTGNELIGMLKYSSLASVIGFAELAGNAAQIYSVNLRTVELLIVISFWYFVLTSVLSIGQHFLEQRFGRGFGRPANNISLATRIKANLRLRRVTS